MLLFHVHKPIYDHTNNFDSYVADFFKTAFNADDFQGLGRRKIWRLINLFLSEFFATAVTVYLGCAIIQSGLFGKGQDHLATAIGFSFAVGTSITVSTRQSKLRI